MESITKKKFGAFSSSANPEEISLTVQSTLKVAGSLIAMLGAIKGINLIIPASVLQEATDAITVVITSGIAIYHAGDILWGLGRRALHFVYGQ